MDIKVNWKELDQESKGAEKYKSRAKVVELKVGNKPLITSPSRGIKICGKTSDFSVWNKITSGILPPTGLAFMHMDIYPETMKNITNTNGKFNGLVNEMSSRLGMVDSKAVKFVCPRIPQTRAKKTKFDSDSLRAMVQFLTQVKGNDGLILPLPPLRRTLQKFDSVIKKSINDGNSVQSRSIPIIGYIPNFEKPLYAGELAKKYVEMNEGISTFIIDFSNGNRIRNALEVLLVLNEKYKKKEIGDYYIHAVNAPKDAEKNPASAFYDLTLPLEGIDSFNNLLWPAGGDSSKGKTPIEYKRSKKFSVASQYGSFNFNELEKRKLLNEKCQCPVCKGNKIQELYDSANPKLWIDMLSVHRMYVEMVELEEFGRTLNESNSLVDYIRTKPMVKTDVEEIMKMLRGRGL